MDRRSLLLAGLAAATAPAPAFAQAQAFAAAASFSASRGGAALVVMRNGVVALEDYPDGAGPNARRAIGQATQSFIPAVVGAMVSDRLMRLDEPVSQTFPEWTDNPWRSAVTLRMLLDGTAALTPNRPVTGPEARALQPSAEPGRLFTDDPAALALFLEAARTKLSAAGRPADPAAYIAARVLAPIGCAPVEWRRMENGEADMIDGASLSPRAWAALGELMRRVGVWRARELIAGAALRDACRGSFLQPRYGFGLWLAWPAPRDAPGFPRSDLWSPRSRPPSDLVMAASLRGDRLFVLPSQRIVAARQSRDAGNSWSDAEFVRLLLNGA